MKVNCSDCFKQDDEDEEEIEDMTIKPTDAVIVCARNEDEVNHLEACICDLVSTSFAVLYMLMTCRLSLATLNKVLYFLCHVLSIRGIVTKD